MATTYQITGLREVVAYTVLPITTNLTNSIVYNAATVLTNLQAAYPGHFLTTANAAAILHLYGSVSTSANPAAASAKPIVVLNFDATTPVIAMDIPVATNPVDSDFCCFGGIQSTAGAGNTGNITVTTTNLASGDVITIVLKVLLAANTLTNG
jgi:hypothetical protein